MHDPSEFPSTQWTALHQLDAAQTAERASLLNELLGRYRGPMVACLAAKPSVTLDQAEDLVQEFILAKILVRDLLRGASPRGGRLRDLLRVSLTNFLRDQLRRQRSRARAERAVPVVEFDDPADDPFDLEWARQLLRYTFEEMRAECAPHILEVFEHRLMRPLLGPSAPTPYPELAELCGLRDSNHAANGSSLRGEPTCWTTRPGTSSTSSSSTTTTGSWPVGCGSDPGRSRTWPRPDPARQRA